MASTVTRNEDDGDVTVATLIRGKSYTFHLVDPISKESLGYYRFERNVPTPLDEEHGVPLERVDFLATALEELTEEVPDGDGDLITKDIFRVDRDAPSRSVRPVQKEVRFRLVKEEVKEKPILRAPARRPVAAPPVKKPGQFRSRSAG